MAVHGRESGRQVLEGFLRSRPRAMDRRVQRQHDRELRGPLRRLLGTELRHRRRRREPVRHSPRQDDAQRPHRRGRAAQLPDEEGRARMAHHRHLHARNRERARAPARRVLLSARARRARQGHHRPSGPGGQARRQPAIETKRPRSSSPGAATAGGSMRAFMLSQIRRRRGGGGFPSQMSAMRAW